MVLTNLAPRPPGRHSRRPRGTADRLPAASNRSVRRPDERRRSRISSASDPDELLDPFIEFEIHRAVQVVGRKTWVSTHLHPSRNGMNRCGCSSSASTIATGRSTWDGPASAAAKLIPVAYTTLPLPSSTKASTPCSLIAARSRAAISRRIRVRSGSSGISIRAIRSGDLGDTGSSRRGHAGNCPRNSWILVLQIRAAFSGPTASTTAASDFSE